MKVSTSCATQCSDSAGRMAARNSVGRNVRWRRSRLLTATTIFTDGGMMQQSPGLYSASLDDCRSASVACRRGEAPRRHPRQRGVGATGAHASERQWGTGTRRLQRRRYGDGTRRYDQARSRAYRGEDGAARRVRRRSRACFALALWNGQDAILKGACSDSRATSNHGEAATRSTLHVDNVPSMRTAKYLYGIRKEHSARH